MLESRLADLKILIVDDQPANVMLVRSILERAGYADMRGESDPLAVLDVVREYDPDLIILDLHMPRRDGFQVMDDLRRALPLDSFLPILVITADATPEVKRRALNGGASDFLIKPFDHVEVRLRVRNLLRTRALHVGMQRTNLHLEGLVRQRTVELEAAHAEILERLALAAEYRDDATGQHTGRVGQMSMLVARELGLPADDVELIERAAPLHDVGKIGIPDAVLLKPGKLDPEEWELMKTHTTIGARLLAGTDNQLLAMAQDIALSHHERWDGNGYPHGRKAGQIPIEACIVAVTDVFDALIHRRPYKPAWSPQEALNEIAAQRGKQFAPDVVDAFMNVTAARDFPVRAVREDIRPPTRHDNGR